MKRKLLICLLIASSFFAKAQETTVNLSMGAGYANQVYYKLSTETTTSFPKNSWDVAFLRFTNYAVGIRVNDGDGIKVYEVFNDASKWNDVDVSQESTWTELYNSDITRADGAFSNGSATSGWGEYNSATHHVVGTVIFVLKYSDGTYKKFICEDAYGGYTFKYATWNGTAWTADTTKTVANSSNPNNRYNYYSLRNDQEVVAEPEATNWDFAFTKYYTDYTTGSGSTVKYNVTGVLQNDKVAVAEATGSDTSSLNYSKDINTIGYDWKSYGGGGFTVDSNKKFYIKYEDGTIYKLYFTAFGGSANGNITFNFEDVTSSLSIDDLGENVAFGVYPNPVNSNRKINLVYDVNKAGATNKVEVFSLTGQQVYAAKVASNKGFYANEINLNGLSAGVYMLRFTSGDYQKTKKIVLSN